MTTPKQNTGSLTIVGTGIKLDRHLTTEARMHIMHADKLYCVVPNRESFAWLKAINPLVESLTSLYGNDIPRMQTYRGMAERVLAEARAGHRVCAVFYGHPGVFVSPSHIALRMAIKEGIPVEMLPGISAEDCIFADLGFDPAARGAFTVEATDLLLRQRIFDPSAFLIIWQIAVIGENAMPNRPNRANLHVLTDYLLQTYPADHIVTVYIAAQFPGQKPSIHQCRLDKLGDAPLKPVSTLVVPPIGKRTVDEAMAQRLGMRG